jgi:hypothetical protein
MSLDDITISMCIVIAWIVVREKPNPNHNPPRGIVMESDERKDAPIGQGTIWRVEKESCKKVIDCQRWGTCKTMLALPRT